VLPASGAKFRGVRQVFESPAKLKFAVTCVRNSVRAAFGVAKSFNQDKWK
jgi:hypothetical protein